MVSDFRLFRQVSFSRYKRHDDDHLTVIIRFTSLIWSYDRTIWLPCTRQKIVAVATCKDLIWVALASDEALRRAVLIRTVMRGGTNQVLLQRLPILDVIGRLRISCFLLSRVFCVSWRKDWAQASLYLVTLATVVLLQVSFAFRAWIDEVVGQLSLC